jgi:hypothetical protein
VNSMQTMTEKDERDFLNGLLREERTPMMARARIENTIAFLTRIKSQLSEE